MSEILTTPMVGCDYSCQIWKKLEVFFAFAFTQLKLQLRNIHKTGIINEYMLSTKKITDTLAATGAPIDPDEQIQAIFNGLPSEFDPFVTSVMSRIDPYSIDMLVVPETFYDPAWYPDSSATNPVTPYSNDLMSKNTFHGDSKLKVANGASSSIIHIGN